VDSGRGRARRPNIAAYLEAEYSVALILRGLSRAAGTPSRCGRGGWRRARDAEVFADVCHPATDTRCAARDVPSAGRHRGDVALRAKVARPDATSGRPAGRVRVGLALVAVALLAGCASGRPLMPTPVLYVLENLPPFRDVPPALQTSTLDVLYVTDRAPERDQDGKLVYGIGRSTSVAFGSAVVRIGVQESWQDLVAAGQRVEPDEPLELTLESFQELGRAPPTPIPWSVLDGRIVPDPVMQAQNQAVGDAFCGELTRRLALTRRKEVFVYVHGIQNSFQDAVFAMGELWHFLGREGVPIAYTWPAGGGGLLRGYTYDRESGEFTAFHLKQFVNGLVECPAVEGISIIAHSRGTDVTVTMLREMTIAERAAGRDPRESLRIRNVVLAAPDLDLGVTFQRAAAEHVTASVGRFTIYTSPNDGAISLAELLFGGLVRLGQLDAARMHQDEVLSEMLQARRGGTGNTAVITYEGPRSGAHGHGYFRENPAVASDIILAVRYGRDPGAEHGRPLKHIEGIFWRVDDDYLVTPSR